MINKSKKYKILILVLIGLVFLGTGCAGKNSEGSSIAQNNSSGRTPVQETTAVKSQSISVRGSDTLLPLAQAEAEKFLNENPRKSVSVTGGGTGVGIAALIDKGVDIATASREITTDEIKKANTNGINPLEHIIAYDGITVIVHPKNPISKLTFNQLHGIYNGSISNWRQVNGEDKQISVISRDTSSGTYADFKKNVLLGDEVRPDALTQATTGGIVTEVAHNQNAIGYIGFAYVDNSTQILSLDKGNGSVLPTTQSILSGTYPLSRSLYFYTNGEPKEGLTKDFCDFVLSEKGQNIVSEVGFIPRKK
jgi:phosphate transport system substrate-binding protein